MISDSILDKILPIPDIDDSKNEVVQELESEGFIINNFRAGGIFNTLLMLQLKCYISIIKFGRKMINNSFLTHADEPELIKLQAKDFSKELKPAIKTEGKVTINRQASGSAIKISKNQIFKTLPDSKGKELRYIVTEDTVMAAEALTVEVPIIAEKPGTDYNVAAGKITQSLIYIEVDEITNTSDWITLEGSDEETVEELRQRALNAWADLAPVATADRYLSVVEAVPGVLAAVVNDEHPRGQGTIDVTVVSATGDASDALITLVESACDAIAAPDDNILVKSANTVSQDISVTLQIPFNVSADGIVSEAEEVLSSLFEIKRGKNLNELYCSDIIYMLKANIANLTNVIVNTPTTDVKLEIGNIIVPGTISITVERLS